VNGFCNPVIIGLKQNIWKYIHFTTVFQSYFLFCFH